MKNLTTYILETKESDVINVIDKVATEFKDKGNLSKSELSNLKSALKYLEDTDSFEEGWIDIAKEIISKCEVVTFNELPIECGYAHGKMFDYADRKVVLLDIKGYAIPFYLSTGQGGKESHGIPSGKWYPFFGIRTNYSRYSGKVKGLHITNVGWMRKGSSSEIRNFYDCPLLKQGAEYLNNKYGDIRSAKRLKAYDNTEDKEKFEKFASAINKGLIKMVGGIDELLLPTSIYEIVKKINEKDN